jgi:hypothetical protein
MMKVKLRDDVSYNEFIELTTGAKGCEIVGYTEYFDTEGIKGMCEAYRDMNDDLIVLVPQADGSVVDMRFTKDECWMWEFVSL